MFEVRFTSRAEREFGTLPNNLKRKFYKELEKLSINPFGHPKVKKIGGTELGYRLRVGRWRILFALFSKERRIEVIDIFLNLLKSEVNKSVK